MSDKNISNLLCAWGDGDRAAGDNLFPIIDDELRRIAASHSGPRDHATFIPPR